MKKAGKRILTEEDCQNFGEVLNLAKAYQWGYFGETDALRAERLFRVCTHSRDKAIASESFYHLGNLYYHGLWDDEADFFRAYCCFVKSVMLAPNRKAFVLLADMYRYGQFVEKNERIASNLYEKARA